jgi:hypothetical protein
MADLPKGTWGHLKVQVPDIVSDVGEPLSELMNDLVSFFTTASSLLDFAKSFAPDYIDPLAALVQQLVTELDGLAADFRDLGLYITGDWALAKPPYEDLRGGFQAYQTRMLARMTDRDDPTRPDISPATTIVAAFFYTSVDFQHIDRMLSFLNNIRRVFNLDFSGRMVSSFPVPRIKAVYFGSESTNVTDFDSYQNILSLKPTSAPTLIRIVWDCPNPNVRDAYNPIPAAGPSGFIVTVSTLLEGVKLVYDRPRPDAVKTAGVQPREFGVVRDAGGTPIVLHGGAELLKLNPQYAFARSLASDGSIEDGAVRIYGVLDNDPSRGILPLENFKHVRRADLIEPENDMRYFQRSFFVSSEQVTVQWPTNEYSVTISASLLPWHADFVIDGDLVTPTGQHKPANYYVRVAACSAELISEIKDKGCFYDMSETNPTEGGPVVLDIVGEFDSSSLSAWSEPKRIMVPGLNTKAFLNAIETALITMALVRPDIPTLDELEAAKGSAIVKAVQEGNLPLQSVALRRTGLEPFRGLLNNFMAEYTAMVRTEGSNPLLFRKFLSDAARKLTLDLYVKIKPTPELESAVAQATARLRTVSWGDILAAFPEVVDASKPMTILSSVTKTVRQQSSIDVINAIDAVPNEGYEQSTFAPLVLAHPHEELDFGLAVNPFSLGISADDIRGVLKTPGVLLGRAPHFVESSALEINFTATASAEDVPDLLEEASPGLRMVYEKYIQEDGSLAVPDNVASYIRELPTTTPIGSEDYLPVFYSRRAQLLDLSNGLEVESVKSRVVFCRSALAEFESGRLMTEAALALGVAASASLRSPEDGEWIAIKAFDAFPPIAGLFDSVLNWLSSFSTGVKSVGETLQAYSDFAQARLTEIQEFIRKIDSLISALSKLSFLIPSGSALMCIAPGTDGLISAFMNAENKPADSPLAYGAGVAFVAPSLPSFILDLFSVTDVEETAASLGALLDGSSIAVTEPENVLDPPDVI